MNAAGHNCFFRPVSPELGGQQGGFRLFDRGTGLQHGSGRHHDARSANPDCPDKAIVVAIEHHQLVFIWTKVHHVSFIGTTRPAQCLQLQALHVTPEIWQVMKLLKWIIVIGQNICGYHSRLINRRSPMFMLTFTASG